MQSNTKPKPILENWMRYHDIVVGWAFDSDEVPNRTPVMTTNVSMWLNDRVRCGDGTEYLLGKPGVYNRKTRFTDPPKESFFLGLIGRARA